jgi:hypothetical protein
MNNPTFRMINLYLVLIMSLFACSSFAEQQLSTEQQKQLEATGKHRELVLGGDAKATWEESCIVSGCGGRGCNLTMKTAVVEDRIYVDGERGSCDHYGHCYMCIRSSTSTVLNDLPRKKYTIYTPKSFDRVYFTILPNDSAAK